MMASSQYLGKIVLMWHSLKAAYFRTDETDAPMTIESATETPSSSIPPENKQDRDTPSSSTHQDGSTGEVEEKKDEDSVNEGTSQVTPQQPTADTGKWSGVDSIGILLIIFHCIYRNKQLTMPSVNGLFRYQIPVFFVAAPALWSLLPDHQCIL